MCHATLGTRIIEKKKRGWVLPPDNHVYTIPATDARMGVNYFAEM